MLESDDDFERWLEEFDQDMEESIRKGRKKDDDICDIKYEGGFFTGKYTRYFDGENPCDQAYAKNMDLIFFRGLFLFLVFWGIFLFLHFKM